MSIGNHLRLRCNSLVTFSLCVLKSIKKSSTLNQKSRAKTGLIICLSAKQWGSHCVFMEVTVVHVCQTVLWYESAETRLLSQSAINPVGCESARALCTGFIVTAVVVCLGV